MISVEQCVAQLMTHAEQFSLDLETENTSLLKANGKILAEDICSNIDVPPHDNSAMDGYAFNTEDLNDSTTLELSQRIQAGDSPQALRKGTAARIFTGANIPAGANTVEMQENCVPHTEQNTVTITSKPELGKNIRRQGQDISKGSVVIEKGSVLRAQELGLLASIGINTVGTYKTLTVAVLNTGDELIEPGNPLPEGKIYNSNRFLLEGILSGWGFTVMHHTIAEDDLESTKTALSLLAGKADIILSTGGVSVGEEDHIKPAVEALGELDLWKVAIKPGKPFAFGRVQNTPFVGLPGNPASVFVTLLILARPYLLAQQGIKTCRLQPEAQYSQANFSRKAGKRDEYLRCKSQNQHVDAHPNQSSGVLSSASWGDCFVRQAAGNSIEKGNMVSVYSYASLLSLG
jgi:molybdopterin molybdotransferase